MCTETAGVEEAAGEGLAEGAEGAEGVAEESAEGSEASLAHGEAAQVAEAQGWSVEGLMDASDQALLSETNDTVPLLDSNGEVATTVSPEEMAIYDSAGLQAEEVAGRECLVRDDINWQQTDSNGVSNIERAADGLAPVDAQRETYDLHHVQQENDGQLAELSTDDHRGAANDAILHDKVGASEIDREAFREIRAEHWQARAEQARAEGLA